MPRRLGITPNLLHGLPIGWRLFQLRLGQSQHLLAGLLLRQSGAHQALHATIARHRCRRIAPVRGQPLRHAPGLTLRHPFRHEGALGRLRRTTHAYQGANRRPGQGAAGDGQGHSAKGLEALGQPGPRAGEALAQVVVPLVAE